MPHAPCVILANFEFPKRGGQVDFVVITGQRTQLLELKCFACPVIGTENGPWKITDHSGVTHEYDRNPWTQTRDLRYALNDAMHAFRKRDPAIPGPAKGHYFSLDASVVIYPRIHPSSRILITDNFKARVQSYPDALRDLTSRTLASTWTMDTWRSFATEYLGLARVSIDQALEPEVARAHHTIATYRENLRRFLAKDLPPLLTPAGTEQCGHNLLMTLFGPGHHLAIGTSGLGKTHHLKHAGRHALTTSEEVPIMVTARRYQGDFRRLLQHAIGPYTTGSPSDLFTSIQVCGFIPLILVDGITDLTDLAQADLLQDLLALQTRYGARIIATSHHAITTPGGLKLQACTLAPLSTEHRRAIYAYHAGTPATAEIDHLATAFRTAYDLTVAGKCHATHPGIMTRADLYDQYTREGVPKDYPGITLGLLRHLAGVMNEQITTVLSRDEYERHASRYLRATGAPDRLVDDVCHTRLLTTTGDEVSFEHDLLYAYFLAEHLRWEIPTTALLAHELERPRYQPLGEFLLPRDDDPGAIRALLAAITDSDLLIGIRAGHAGPLAQQVVIEDCQSLIHAAIEDLATLTLTVETIPRENGTKAIAGVTIHSKSAWTPYHARLCDVIARGLQYGAFTDEFLELLDLTEWTLRRAAQQAGEAQGLSPRRCWDETLCIFGPLLRLGACRLPFESILSALRFRWTYPAAEQPSEVLTQALMRRVERDQLSHVALLIVLQALERHSQPHIDRSIRLARSAADTKLHGLRICAVDLLQSIAGQVMTVCPERREEAVAILESMLPPGAVDLIGALGALSAYGTISSPVTPEQAGKEVRGVVSGAVREGLAPLLEFEPGLTLDDAVAEYACSLVGHIFEDVFEGVYYDAYQQLTDEDKTRFLAWASRACDRGMFSTWILHELLRLGTVEAHPVFGRYAARVDTAAPWRQQAVGSFILGVIGWARNHDQPHAYHDESTPEQRAWAGIAGLIHASHRSMPPEEVESYWRRLASQPALTVAGVLHDVQQATHVLDEHSVVYAKLLASGPSHLRQILEQALADWELFPLNERQTAWLEREIIGNAISTLSLVGDRTTINSLARWADDPVHGKDAIRAITAVRARRRAPTE